MSKEVKHRRGTALEHETFTGADAELTVETTNSTLRLHDNVKVGGHKFTPDDNQPYKSFDSRTTAIAFVTANPDTIERLSTASRRNEAECLALSIPYPDGGGVDEYIVGTGFGTADGSVIIDAGTKQLKVASTSGMTVLHFGAVGNGSFNDAPAMKAAYAHNSKSVIFPTDTPSNYHYGDATPITVLSHPEIGLTTDGTKTIFISQDTYLFERSSVLTSMLVENVNIQGGKGFYRNTYTGSNVQESAVCRKVLFRDYTQCAWSEETSDHPYVTFEDCTFRGASGLPTIGAALSGLQDLNMFLRCKFQRNKYHIKVPCISGSLTITQCGFISFDSAVDQGADIWITPHPEDGSALTGSGPGWTVDDNRFGLEFQSVNKPKILIANALAGGTDVAEPDYANTAGVVSGWTFTNNRIAGGDSWLGSFVRSYIKKVIGCEISNNKIGSRGGMKYMLEFMTPPTEFTESGNTIRDNIQATFASKLANVPLTNGIDFAVDTKGNSLGRSYDTNTLSDSGFLSVYNKTDMAGSTAGSVSILPILNNDYGTNTAARLTFSGSGQQWLSGVSSLFNQAVILANEGELMHLELDALKSPTNSLSDIYVEVFENSPTNQILLRGSLHLTDKVRRYKVSGVIPAIIDTVTPDIRIAITSIDPVTGVSDSCDVSNMSLYIAPAVASTGHLRTQGTGLFNSQHLVLGNYHIWVGSGGALRIKNGPPTSDADGDPV